MNRLNFILFFLVGTLGAASLDDLTWEVVEGEVTITNCDSNASGELVIPDQIGGFPVTAIGDAAFAYCLNLEKVTIPDSAATIGGSAFESCERLIEVILPESLTEIEDSLFSRCFRLQQIVIPEGVLGIGKNAFLECFSLTHVTISEGVVSIEEFAFKFCYATEIIVPDSVNTIGEGAFYGCFSLADVSIPEGVVSINASTFAHCRALTNITIPDSVTVIGDCAFDGCGGLGSITIPDSVVMIGNAAFRYCSLDSFSVGKGLTNLGFNNFNEVYDSGGFDLPDTVEIAQENESLISLNGVVFCKPTNTLKLYTQGGTTRRDYTIPDGVPTIGEMAFFGSRLASVNIPNSVTKIEAWSFSNMTFLENIEIPDSVTVIGERAFWVESEETSSSLRNVTLGEGVTHIGAWAFGECYLLDEVTIPASVVFIGEGAFAQTYLSRMIFDGFAPEIEWPGTLTLQTNCIMVWPQHADSFSGEGSGWDSYTIKLRDSSLVVSPPIVEGATLSFTVSSAPGKSYVCKSSPDLVSFEMVATNPAVIEVGSTGRVTFTVEAEGAVSRKFFVIEEVP